MTLSPPCYYIPSADVVAFKTSVCLLDYHAACSEGEKSPRAQLGLSIMLGTCMQRGWLALRTWQDEAGTRDRQDSSCKGLARQLGNAFDPTSTQDPALCWVRNLPVHICWREVMVCYAWVQTNNFCGNSQGKKFCHSSKDFEGQHSQL